MGAYHTLDLELNRKFTLGKHEWDTVALERIGNNKLKYPRDMRHYSILLLIFCDSAILFGIYVPCKRKSVISMIRTDQACDPTQHADLAAIVMQEGLAQICLVTSSMTLVRAKIETNIPRKRKGSCTQHDKVFYFASVLSFLLIHEYVSVWVVEGRCSNHFL